MQFSSLLFVTGFLPVFLILYSLMPGQKGKNGVLLVFSLLFYAFGGIAYLLLLVVLTAISFFTGKRLEVLSRRRRGKGLMALHTVLLLAVLAFFKYSGFLIGSLPGVHLAEEGLFSLALPLGISFYTFKLIAYTADVKNGRCPAEKSFGKLLLYTVTFHHVVQGPIVRYTDVGPQISKRPFSWALLYQGTGRFVTGLAKKVILADHCGELADLFLPLAGDLSSLPAAGLWVGSICFTLQMYLDFSAYSDMAIGLGQMTGFSYRENFNYPYTAVSVRDFWRRWHISLSSFFRDYVYIPLGGNRKGGLRRTLNLLAVWFLTGLWHGASWNFVLWGLYYFVFVCLENLFSHGKKKEIPRLLRLPGHLYTILVFHIGWVLFRFEDFDQLKAALMGLSGASGQAFMSKALSLQLQNQVFFLIAAVLACTPIVPFLKKKWEEGGLRRGISPGILYGAETLVLLVLLVLSIFVMAGSTYRPFLYNQF